MASRFIIAYCMESGFCALWCTNISVSGLTCPFKILIVPDNHMSTYSNTADADDDNDDDRNDHDADM